MKVTVIQSAVIDAPIDRVWAVLRDFIQHHILVKVCDKNSLFHGVSLGRQALCVKIFMTA